MTDMTRETRCADAERVVREQRDPDGEYCGLHVEPDSIVEAFALQELERLQRAVMGEHDRSDGVIIAS